MKIGAFLGVVSAFVGSLVGAEEAWADSWGNYQNGRIPEDILTPIPWRSQYRLRSDAVNALSAMNSSFKSAFGFDLRINDGYRDYAGQVEARRVYGSRAAPPGTSVHGWALAVDIGDRNYYELTFGHEIYAWLKGNASTYGWIHPAWAEPGGSKPEAWHWEFSGFYGGPSTQEEDLKQDERDALFQMAWAVEEIRKALLNGRPEYYGGQYRAIDVLLSHTNTTKDVVNEMKPLVQDTQIRVRGEAPDKDMLQANRDMLIAILNKVNSLT